ncbi:concanavalin A-like lectin/glucanase, partial [Exidia glandulosa HHB12029]
RTTGWWNDKHLTFDEGFHTYTLEWDDKFLWTYIDSRVNRIFNFRFDANKPFFNRGGYPATVFNGTQEVRLENPWAGSDAPGVAPFDQSFYLILDVAVGGTNGWFPDGQGKKPWVNGAATAMRDFARAKDTWYPTWPTDLKQRSMAVDYVRMYQKC